MKPATKYILLPMIAPAMIVGLYLTPLSIIPCKVRGLVAIFIALLSAVAAFVAIFHGYSASFKRNPAWIWWFFSALIYASPLALLLGPLG